jgi:competence protein ComEC
MNKSDKQKFWIQIGVIALFFIVSASLIAKAFSVEAVVPSNILKVAVLDVGQGDAIYIEAPNGNQVLFDAGKDGKILQKLHEIMPSGDTSINAIFATNPDADHIGGIDDVLHAYDVGVVFEPGTISTTKTYQTFRQAVLDEENAQFLLARAGTKLVLDEKNGVAIEILFPDQNVSKWTRNDGSIVARLMYGESSFILMGDATSVTENYLIKKYGSALDADVLKVGHHGSRTSTSGRFLEYVTPEISVVSYGAGNSYGHPHPDVVSRIGAVGSDLFGTGELGEILIETNGVLLETKTEF